MENLRCTWNIFSNLSPTLVRIFPLLYNVANKTRGGFHDRKSEKKGVSLIFRNQSETQAFYYISAAQFSDTHAYFRVFYTASKKVLIKRAALSSQQQLSLITSNLGEKIDNISNYAITLSINSNIADVLKENPTVPENTLEHFLVNSELTDQAQRIIGLHKNIYAWDILDTENHWFHSSTTETDQLDSILGPEVLDSLQTNLAFQFLGPFQISGEPTFVALKSITNIDNTKYLGALVLLIRETNISSAFRDLPDSSSRDFYITDENGQILSSSSSGGIYKDFSSYTKISSENYKTLTETDRQFFSVDGTDTLFICKSYPDLNWNVINLIPLESLTLDHMVILHNILLISIVVFILSVFFPYYVQVLSPHLYRNLWKK